MPDLRHDFQTLVTDESFETARCVVTGTFTGEYGDLRAEAGAFRVDQGLIARTEGGKIAGAVLSVPPKLTDCRQTDLPTPQSPMKRNVTLMLVGSLAACATTRHAARGGSDEAQIQALVNRGTRALETHDWASYATFWANDPDIEVIHPAAAEWVVGWDSVAAKYRRLIADTSTFISANSHKQRIHMSPSRDMAWVTQEDLLTIGPAGKQVSIVQWSTAVYEKRKGEWRLVHAHASIPPRR